MAVAEAPVKGIAPFGWQAGSAGFLFLGMGAPYCPWREWDNFLYLAVVAGRFAGKSYIGAARHLLYVEHHPESVNLIAAPDYTTIHRGTLPALEKVLGLQGLQRGVHYEFNWTRQEILWWNKAKSLLVSLDDPKAGRSIRAASIWLDEPGYVSWESFRGLQPTMTQTEFPHQMWMTGTPVGKQHWLYAFLFPREAFEERYTKTNLAGYIRMEKGSIREERKEVRLINPEDPEMGLTRRVCIFAETKDNPYEGAHEDFQMQMMYGKESALYQQEAKGRFTVLEDMTYPMWNTDYHARERKEWPEGEQDPGWKPDVTALGVDFGTDHPAAIIVKGVDHSGRWFTLDEWRERGSNPTELAREAARLAKKWGAADSWSDHDPVWRWPLEDALIEVGCSNHLANKQFGRLNDPSGGIGNVGYVLNKKLEDGSQGCFVDRDACPMYIREMENYQRLPEVEGRSRSERPKRTGDDLMDADRYVTTGMLVWHYDESGYDIGPRTFKTSFVGM